MTIRHPKLLLLFTALFIASCSNSSRHEPVSLTAYDGSSITIDNESSMTLLFFFSMSNPVAIGEFNKLQSKIDEDVESVAIAMHVDRPPNITILQQKTLIPIVIDSGNKASSQFEVDLTPSLLLLKEGAILLRQRGSMDYDIVNQTIRNN
jgi:hypothetical protein